MALQPERLVLADGQLMIRSESGHDPWPIGGAGPKEKITLAAITQVCDGKLSPAFTLVKDPARTDILNAALKIRASNGTLIYRITDWDMDAMAYTLEWPD